MNPNRFVEMESGTPFSGDGEDEPQEPHEAVESTDVNEVLCYDEMYKLQSTPFLFKIKAYKGFLTIKIPSLRNQFNKQFDLCSSPLL